MAQQSKRSAKWNSTVQCALLWTHNIGGGGNQQDSACSLIFANIESMKRSRNEIRGGTVWSWQERHQDACRLRVMLFTLFYCNSEPKQDSGAPGRGSLSVSSISCLWEIGFSLHDLHSVPKGRFKQLLIREGWGCRDKRGAVKKQ